MPGCATAPHWQPLEMQGLAWLSSKETQYPEPWQGDTLPLSYARRGTMCLSENFLSVKGCPQNVRAHASSMAPSGSAVQRIGRDGATNAASSPRGGGEAGDVDVPGPPQRTTCSRRRRSSARRAHSASQGWGISPEAAGTPRGKDQRILRRRNCEHEVDDVPAHSCATLALIDHVDVVGEDIAADIEHPVQVRPAREQPLPSLGRHRRSNRGHVR